MRAALLNRPQILKTSPAPKVWFYLLLQASPALSWKLSNPNITSRILAFASRFPARIFVVRAAAIPLPRVRQPEGKGTVVLPRAVPGVGPMAAAFALALLLSFTPAAPAAAAISPLPTCSDVNGLFDGLSTMVNATLGSVYMAAISVYVLGGAGFTALLMQSYKMETDLKANQTKLENDLTANQTKLENDLTAIKAAVENLKGTQSQSGTTVP